MHPDPDMPALDLTEADLNPEMGQEPRIHDLRLGEALEFERPRAIRQIIERNMDELERYGPVITQMRRVEDELGRSRHTPHYWLNEQQALLICMFSRTDRAADVRQQVIGIYMAWKHGQLPPAPRHRRQDDLSEYLRGSGEISVESVQNRLSYWKHQRDYAQERVDSLLERFPLLNRPRR